jgi:tRNA-splicing ligase RtcB
MKIIDGIPVCGEPVDEGAMVQIRNCRRFVEGAALTADHHKGYSIPIGGVLWSQELISPSAVGFDIGCGNKAVLTNLLAEETKPDMSRIMDEVFSQISFGIGRAANWELDNVLFDHPAWGLLNVSKDPHLKGIKDLARRQLGTVGSGNHYVDIFTDELGRIWVGVHFGSRGLGHKTATHFLEASGKHSEGMDSDPVMFHEKSDIGADYIECMKLAGEYAYAGRDAVCAKVLEILGATEVQAVHNHHNFAWRETAPDGRQFWVMRKGATPAYPGQLSFVGATMAEPSVILEGVDSDLSRDLFYSTVHGAGRVMSRSAATGKVSRKTGELMLDKEGNPQRAPKVTKEMMNDSVRAANVHLRGAGVDESPHCYKRLDEVLSEQGNTVKVLHRLTPLGVAMAGADTFDPYKD